MASSNLKSALAAEYTRLSWSDRFSPNHEFSYSSAVSCLFHFLLILILGYWLAEPTTQDRGAVEVEVINISPEPNQGDLQGDGSGGGAAGKLVFDEAEPVEEPVEIEQAEVVKNQEVNVDTKVNVTITDAKALSPVNTASISETSDAIDQLQVKQPVSSGGGTGLGTGNGSGAGEGGGGGGGGSSLEDSIGNLAGEQHDWVKKQEFRGKRILLACGYIDRESGNGEPFPKVCNVLRRIGFKVDAQQFEGALPPLDDYDQCWIVSGSGVSRFAFGGTGGDSETTKSIRRFLKRGKGVYVLADNAPWLYQANEISTALHSATIQGNYAGEQLIHVAQGQQGFTGAGKKITGMKDGILWAADHELLSGLNAIYEGVTISHLSESPKLHVVLRASNNLPLVSVSRDSKELVVYDCGFTRMFSKWEENIVSSSRWYQNVAAYLMGKKRRDLRGGEESGKDSPRGNQELQSSDIPNLSPQRLIEASAIQGKFQCLVCKKEFPINTSQSKKKLPDQKKKTKSTPVDKGLSMTLSARSANRFLAFLRMLRMN